MEIQSICSQNKEKYVCLTEIEYDGNNLIKEASIIKVYDTLEEANENKPEILKMMKMYKTFDIVYGDYKDYVETRSRYNGRVNYSYRDVNDVSRTEKLDQEYIDYLFNIYKKGESE